MSSYSVAWAFKLRGVNPLAKLIAIRLADGCADNKISIGKLVEWCGALPREIWEALDNLGRIGGLVWDIEGGILDFRLPEAAQEQWDRSKRDVDQRPLFLYVITCGEKTKIGITRDVKARLAGLQEFSPIKMEVAWQIVGPTFVIRRAERLAHEILKDRRLFGEWFSVPVADAIKAAERALEEARAMAK